MAISIRFLLSRATSRRITPNKGANGRIGNALLGGILVLPGVIGSQAVAQQAAASPPPDGLEEIVVTARQREERINDVPATVVAFSAADMETARIDRPRDFIGLTPGISAVQTVEVGDMQIQIRGINSGRDTESSFALVVDGVQLSNPNTINQELNGVTQIEILKGPQGALYGRNALAGAIIITTKKPTDDFEVDARGGGGNYHQYNGSLSFSGPLMPNLKGDIRAYTTSTNGSFTNSLTGCNNCENNMRESGINGRLIFTPNDATEFDIKARYSHIDAGGVNFNASLALFQAASFYEANPGLLPPGVNGADFYENPNHHNFVYLNLVPPQNDQYNRDLSIKGTFDVGLGTLTSTLSFNDETNKFISDGTSNAFGIYDLNPVCQQSYANAAGTVPLPSPFFYADPHGSSANIAASFLPPYPPVTCGGYQYQQRDQKDGAFELRLASSGDQALRWMGGIYLGQINRHLVVSYGGDLGTGQYDTGYVPPTGPNPTDLLFDDTFKSNIYAAFGNIAHDLSLRREKDAELAFAIRYDIEDRTDDNNVPKINPGTPGFDPLYLSQLAAGQTPTPVCTPGIPCSYYINPYYNANPDASSIPSRHKSFAQPQPKLTFNWKIVDDISTYASYGYGFRSGGFNSAGDTATLKQYYGGLKLDIGPFAGTPNLNFNYLTDEFKKEVSRAAELGFKTLLFDHSLAWNGAAYITRVQNMQNFSFYAGPFGSLRIVDNIDRVNIAGVETDLRYRANQYVSVLAGAGYTNAIIEEYNVRPYTVGNKVPYVPNTSANLGLQLQLPIPGRQEKLFMRIDEPYTGKTWFSTVQNQSLPNAFTAAGFGEGNFSKQYRSPYAVTNLHTGIEGGTWNVTAWCTNLTNKQYLEEVIPAPEFGGSFIHNTAGRMFGLDFAYHFSSGKN